MFKCLMVYSAMLKLYILQCSKWYILSYTKCIMKSIFCNVERVYSATFKMYILQCSNGIVCNV